MTLDDLPTPCLVLDRAVLVRNLERMDAAVARHPGVAFRPHLKTAKSVEVARLVRQVGAAPKPGITVSTLAEAEYFAGHGLRDILYAVGITPRKLEQVRRLNDAGAEIAVITDDAATAARIGQLDSPPRTLIEIDTGEGRGGLAPDAPALPALAASLGRALAGVMTHAGHSYGARGAAALASVAAAEVAGARRAVATLAEAGFACPIVSIGSSPTALIDGDLTGITELRAGVYMFGDLFQAGIGTHGPDGIAVTVLTSVIGVRSGQILLDAGGIALSKDRSTADLPPDRGQDWGFGHVLDRAGRPSLGAARVIRAYQEHGVAVPDPTIGFPPFAVGDLVRVAPNHVCMTAAAHDRYYVVDGGDDVVAVWQRVNGW